MPSLLHRTAEGCGSPWDVLTSSIRNTVLKLNSKVKIRLRLQNLNLFFHEETVRMFCLQFYGNDR